ncbi:MAG: polyribonucleotide nucleotidyltransferase [Planctomycetaceae bacterium]|nr:polyribonucleotide nucleotidyltransferase [Planctomycetaceae bacterium]
MAHVSVEREIGGRTLKFETGKWAKQADATVVVSYADTVVICAVVRGDPRPGIDFFPLQVDYRERTSAAGKFPGGFRKREGAPNQKEILTMRLIDRPIRPLFQKGLRDEVAVQCWVESADGQNDTDVVAGSGAAAALAISSLPFNGPIATVRVGQVDGNFVVNPTIAEMEYSTLDLVLSGHRDGINMIEVGAQEVSQEDVLGAIKFGHEQIMTILDMIDELVEQAGQDVVFEPSDPPAELVSHLTDTVTGPLTEAKRTDGKLAREEAVKQVLADYLEQHCPVPGEDDNVSYTKFLAIEAKRSLIKDLYHDIEEAVTRKIIMEGTRTDGRPMNEVRPISVELDVLPRAHGSALFTRGETQSLVVCTLGVGRDEQIVDGLGDEYAQKFYLHYNFPPFCTGEAKRIMGPGRREIGHGALAERSLIGALPGPDEFPYTIRILSEILESNGSSSMASVCGGSLAMMAAGVPMSGTCAGISIGMVEEDGKRLFLTDILGEEDHFGDMDFKVAGTRKGITGIQLDLKTRGLTVEIVTETLKLAHEARMTIIDQMESAIAKGRDEISQYAPRLLTTKINPEKIGKLIGPGGKTIRALQETTGAVIEVEEDGTVLISASGGGKAERARDEIEKLCEEVQVGRVYSGKVSSIKDFGAFIEVVPGQDGLCHISELDDGFVQSVADIIQLGEEVRVKVISIDDQGRLKLSRRAAMQEDAGDGGQDGATEEAEITN